MSLKNTLYAATAMAIVTAGGAAAENLVVATVNNGDMIRMQGYTDEFTAKTGHEVEWVTLEENALRTRVTTDISTKGGAFDIMTIGMYETPIWGANGWLVPLDGPDCVVRRRLLIEEDQSNPRQVNQQNHDRANAQSG